MQANTDTENKEGLYDLRLITRATLLLLLLQLLLLLLLRTRYRHWRSSSSARGYALVIRAQDMVS
jgi:hypothetical protein